MSPAAKAKGHYLPARDPVAAADTDAHRDKGVGSAGSDFEFLESLTFDDAGFSDAVVFLGHSGSF